jgi:hypothetical protein
MASALAPMRESPQFTLVAVVGGVGAGVAVAGEVVIAVGSAGGAGLLDEE